MIAEITDEFIHKVSRRLKQGKGIRWKIPPHGCIHIDRPLPFLCIYRYSDHSPDKWTGQLIRSEASYLIASASQAARLSELVKSITETLSDQFGACLLIEVWAASPQEILTSPTPTFRIFGPPVEKSVVVEKFAENLRQLNLLHLPTSVELREENRRQPVEMPALLRHESLKTTECLSLGLEIQPFYLNTSLHSVYPLSLRLLNRELSKALKSTFFEFVRLETTHTISAFQELGNTHIDRAVWEADQQLAQISQSFQFLLLVTPINAKEAWEEFKETKFKKPPHFHYRLLPIDPDVVKRELYNIPIEKITDPTLAYILRDKRHELDKMITMLADRNTPNFRLSSLQLFGGVSTSLRQTAEQLLQLLPMKEDSETQPDTVSAQEFARRALEEIDYFRAQYADVAATVKIRDDVVGLMVSEGNLHIQAQSRIPRKRVEALIQHEVGTHILTYYNGKAQPLQQLYCGVPGYEELQEGLAVLSEYLVGGLTHARLRLLAARVIAVSDMIDGASFQQVFSQLTEQYGFAPLSAFNVAMRVFRGGGLTKDAVYLRGLVSLLVYLREGNELEPLLLGKIRQDYIPIVQELIYRRVLRTIPIKPRYLSDPLALAKLRQLKKEGTVFTLLNPHPHENRIFSE
ncbi:flavohemoglobin expression-modulating QEGLA motif protein [Rhodocytophaga aerolata]|uniref:Flavohemoglobin expression-modulating QEGLA motif protein n=1 Tax=Rhodocytophaga aerolata TaxID=455078 RepID=A0ABT8RAE5_9BACT|nr:flavohemoglobin expression-modulating QEGLA motif protein [Rhodocytophaga aerolata]MDO1447732.1 flavohemoglobin expression-modulating QEGLA motif protein [Rhodocytophaga aerolata]